ncbi:MAG: hypothetical protein L0210_04130 [Rhodospirillales bacterium]|nr:hypothetical protein [Rhodospirillales bacterium]
MSKPATFIIESADITAGIVVQERSGFRFYASDQRLLSLDGQVFRSTRAAERAVENFAMRRPTQRPGAARTAGAPLQSP